MSKADTSPVTPADGPVAVTGSGGYIGSHIVKNLVEHGYEVWACERYNLVATGESGMMHQQDLQALMEKMYPDIAVGGIYREGKQRRSPVSTLQKPITQLGLKPHTVKEPIRDNVNSLLIMGLIQPRRKSEGWQREGNDLGIKSKWSPHAYPSLGPDPKKQELKTQT